ncbi:xanthine dehydrogenase family protein molybdopterin-binding subunit [Bradyrhizobium prioriisuperbiae]|uniref:xanthine dehydrogenase family protein molybdopterin-binding subunit n=1 Tax=Bradyrhizobium prioriisuperbiae TaxID=2854389 RepID=UPI0028E94BAF|nr:molybdopterin cofactor-binding domain-containing protein [Bradyrhizobium prioritasuperba]
MRATGLSRREFGQGFGVLVAAFAMSPLRTFGQTPQSLPMSLRANRRLDGWIRIEADGTVTVFTGKAELGQGILTSLAQIVAEELDVGFDKVRMIGADTSRGPDEQYTYGSQSVEQSGAALRVAGAQARAVLLAAAASRFNAPVADLKVADGVITTRDGRLASYWDIAKDDAGVLSREVTADAMPKRAGDLKIVGSSVARSDLPAKLTAVASYVQDIRLPGMVFGRVMRPPHYGAKLIATDLAGVRAMPGVIAVVQDGNFLGVVAEREEQAIAARQRLIEVSRWSDGAALPDATKLREELQRLRSEDTVIAASGQSEPLPATAKRIAAVYTRPYLSQGTIGPSCAVAWLRDGHMTVWSHTQGAYPLRGDLAKVLDMPLKQVDVVHTSGSGCYGHNGADDAALDAALLARATAGRPVKLQWMRDDEFGWAPFGPAMAMQAEAGLSAEGKIVDWAYDVWSNSHAMRPGQSGGVNLLAAWHSAKAYGQSPPLRIPQPYGDGDRNAVPSYELARKEIRNHLLLETPIRNGSLRTLGAHGNIFAIESFMDELALAAGADPVAFRLAHLKDPRAIAVLEAAAQRAQWKAGVAGDGRRGRGVAYSRYKNIGTYAAAVLDVEVDPDSGSIRVPAVVIAVDVGRVINPDGVVNQIEGGLLQGISLTMKEQVTFDRRQITSRDWSSYPILTFPEIPKVEVVLIDRPTEASLGAGEGSLGPASAALANAFAHATGRRLRDLPMTPDRVKRALA